MNVSVAMGRSLALLALCGAMGCKGGGGPRIMDENEDDYLGTEQAGAAVYDRLIEGSVNKLLERHRAQFASAGGLKVAFLGVENASGEELGEWRAHLFELIDTSVNTFSGYNTISDRYVNAALRESRLVQDDLFLPKHQRTFQQSLERSDQPVECLLFAKLTRGSTRGESVTQRNYALTLELVDLSSGERDKVTERLRKVYDEG